MRASFLVLPLALLGALGGACGPASPEEALADRIAELRRTGRLPAPPGPDARGDPPGVRAFFRRCEEIQVRLEAQPPELDDRPALDAFQAEAGALVGLEVCREALARGTSLARPLLRIPAPPEARLVDTPSLLVVRRWTELLSARARLAARDPDGGAAAIESLRTALELLFVWNDHSLLGEVICSSQEGVVLETLQAVAPLPGFDARALRTAVDPYLAPRGHAGLVATVKLETGTWMGAVESLLASRTTVTPETMERLGFSGPSLVQASHSLLDRHEAILELRDDPCRALPEDAEEELGPRLGDAVREWHSRNIRRALARVALAVVEQRNERGEWPKELADLADGFAAGVPAHPCEHLRFDYDATESGFRLTSVERRHPEHVVPGPAWIWPQGAPAH